MKIVTGKDRPAKPGNPQWFTGDVRIEALIDAPDPARVAASSVTFQPGARTAWHTHPLGQTLVVLTGRGRVQLAGQPVQEIGPGDVVWIEPDERHWHGAAPDSAMTHIAIQEKQDGSAAEWFEPVSEADYGS